MAWGTIVLLYFLGQLSALIARGTILLKCLGDNCLVIFLGDLVFLYCLAGNCLLVLLGGICLLGDNFVVCLGGQLSCYVSWGTVSCLLVCVCETVIPLYCFRGQLSCILYLYWMFVFEIKSSVYWTYIAVAGREYYSSAFILYCIFSLKYYRIIAICMNCWQSV